MQLRIDGRLATLSATPTNLGGGNLVAKAASGSGLDIRIADGTALMLAATVHDLPRFFSILVFGMSLITLYVVSAIYHIGFHDWAFQHWLFDGW